MGISSPRRGNLTDFCAQPRLEELGRTGRWVLGWTSERREVWSAAPAHRAVRKRQQPALTRGAPDGPPCTPPLLARQLARGPARRTRLAHRDRRRRPAAGRHARRPDLGQLPVARGLPVAARDDGRAGRAEAGSHAVGMGWRRPARRLLPGRRHGAQARARRRRPARPGEGRPAGGGRPGRSRRPRAVVPGGDHRRPCSGARLGRTHRHRHRLRPRGAGGPWHPPAQRSSCVPAHARGGRRHRGHHHHRRRLHQRPPAVGAARRPGPAARLRRGSASSPYRLVAAHTVGLRHLDPGARVRGARDGGRGAARPDRARTTGGRRAQIGGRALRAPDSTVLGRRRRACLRAVRRGGHAGRRRTGQRAARPRLAGRGAGPGRRQVRRHHGRHLAHRPLHPRRARRPPGLGRRAGRLAAGRHRVHRQLADRRAGVRRRQSAR